jgi:AcrR family transcriptional regulator
MSSVKTRTPTRRERAAATRQRMIQAAIEVFIEAGYAGARMPDVAERAGVAVQTLYYSFGTKIELFRACMRWGVQGPGDLPPEHQPFWAEVDTARSGRAALAAFVRGNAEILTRAAELDEVQKAATHEPEAAAMVAGSERLRRTSQREVVAKVAERFGLRAGLDVETATDLFVMFCGTEIYLTLKRAGWPEDTYVAWLTDTLARQLLARPGRIRQRSVGLKDPPDR